MDVRDFLVSLLDCLSGLESVKKVDLNAEVFVLKGCVWIEGNRYLQVYFNEITGTTAFALIEKGREFGVWILTICVVGICIRSGKLMNTKG